MSCSLLSLSYFLLICPFKVSSGCPSSPNVSVNDSVEERGMADSYCEGWGPSVLCSGCRVGLRVVRGLGDRGKRAGVRRRYTSFKSFLDPWIFIVPCTERASSFSDVSSVSRGKVLSALT